MNDKEEGREGGMRTGARKKNKKKRRWMWEEEVGEGEGEGRMVRGSEGVPEK